MSPDQSNYMDVGKKEKFFPQEEMLETSRKSRKISVGLPREIAYQEKRIALVPEAVGLLVNNGHRVFIERGAGEEAHFEDVRYSEHGGEIVSSPEEIYKADIILKIAPPEEEEINMMKEKQVLMSALHILNRDRDFFKKLGSRKITALAFELIRDNSRSYPLLRSMSEIVGKASVMIASRYLSSKEYGKGIMLGGFSGIKPGEVVILGAGAVGENAARAALGLGAQVKIFDHSISRLRRMREKFFVPLSTSIIQPSLLSEALRSADVVIGAIHSEKNRLRQVVTADMVKNMQNGSVIIDVSIDQGGCFETSQMTGHDQPAFKEYGVTHYCVPNIASAVPNTASYALSNYFGPILLKIGEEGGIDHMLKTDYGFCRGVYLYRGIVTNQHISEFFYLPFHDIDLILSAFRG
ncbi:MAG: alanine dehydrogenase [Bacteroidales bacterium]